jgi:hypothetical protein
VDFFVLGVSNGIRRSVMWQNCEKSPRQCAIAPA